jgi:hypothetical protein
MDLNYLPDLPQRELDLIARAGAHCLADENTPDAIRFRGHVTDLDVARLIHQIERGALIVPAGKAWCVRGGRFHDRHLTRIVNECLRLGLVERVTRNTASDVVLTYLIAAPVHLRTGINETRCWDSYLRPGARFRTLDVRRLVDCHACLALTDA